MFKIIINKFNASNSNIHGLLSFLGINKRPDGYYEVFCDISKKVLARGKFEDGYLVEGEYFLFKTNMWYVGTFKRNTWFDNDWETTENTILLNGQGKCYTGYNKKLLVMDGLFENGFLKNGMFYLPKSGSRIIGNFSNGKLSRPVGEFSVYDKDNRIIQHGRYVNDNFIGEKFKDNKWYIGTFQNSLQNGYGEVYEGYTKEKLIMSGRFENGLLINNIS